MTNLKRRSRWEKELWESAPIDIEFVTIGSDEYEVILENWAETVYRHLCQLHEIEISVPQTSTPLAAESTGTDG